LTASSRCEPPLSTSRPSLWFFPCVLFVYERTPLFFVTPGPLFSSPFFGHANGPAAFWDLCSPLAGLLPVSVDVSIYSPADS